MMIHCKYIKTVNIKEGELLKLKNSASTRMYDHGLVMRTIRLGSFLTVPGANKQYSRHKHLKDFKSGHDATVCPGGI